MHALFLIHRYPPARGGSERFVQEMARRLVAEGHRATVYTSDLLDVAGFWRRGAARLPARAVGQVSNLSNIFEQDQGVRVHRFRARVLPLHGAISRALGLIPWPPIGLTMAPPGLVLPGLWRAVRAGSDFDLVHASAYPSPLYLGAVAARRANARLVLMPCSHPSAKRDFGNLERLYRQADALLALTPWEEQMFLQMGVPAERIHVVGAGVNPAEARDADGDRFRRRFGLPPDAPLIAFIGHKTAGKGALYLLDAAQALLADRPDLFLALVGAATPEFTRRCRALPPALRERVLDLRLAEAEKHDLLAACSTLVLPSREDSFGIVLLEAWLHGKPVIGAQAGGIPHVIEEGETGLLVPWGDTAALAQAIAQLLDHPTQAAQMGARGREQTLQRWTWDAVYERVRRAYAG